MSMEEAQAYANDVVKRFMETDGDWKMGHKDLFFLWSFKCQYERLPNGWLFTAPADCMEKLCELATFYDDVRPILRRLLAAKLEHGRMLTEAESYIAGQMLMGKLPDPKDARAGRKKSDNAERNVMIFLLAQHLRDNFGLKFTRNDEATEQNSAADLIAQAFDANRRPDVPFVTFRAVKEVLTDRNVRSFVRSLEKQIAAATEYWATMSGIQNALAPQPSAVPEFLRQYPS